MKRFAALNGLRVGCVQYLNAKPLIAPYEGAVEFAHPGCLADMLAAGAVDVALVPTYEALRRPEYPIVDGVAIASRGDVYSVFLAYRGELSGMKAVRLDGASRTSNSLVRCLLREFHGMTPDYAMEGDVEGLPDDETGVLLIGNQAIRYRERVRPGVRYMDMGGEWLGRTGLPFVYAVWQVRPEVADVEGVAEALRAVKDAGVRRVGDIARGQGEFDAEFAERYLTRHIKFELGDEEKAGLGRFRGMLGMGGGELRFV